MPPDIYSPMLLDERPLDLHEPGWIYEIMYDGYRLMATFGDGKCDLRTRSGAGATKWFPEVTKSLAKIPGGPYMTDGEVCVLDELRRSDYDRLQIRARRRRWVDGADPVVYCVFDLLVVSGKDITMLPLLQRKQMLANLLDLAPPSVLVVGHIDRDGHRFFHEAVLPSKLEGLVAKRADSIYRPGVRSADWVKVKCKGAIPQEQFKRAAR